MPADPQKILLLGSNVLISSLPIKEVSLLHEGSLPAYGYNPGDSLELLAGPASLDQGRQEQCLTWLNSLKDQSSPEVEIRSRTYGDPKEVYQLFRRRKSADNDPAKGWFMFHQILPPEGRSQKELPLDLSRDGQEIFSGNRGIMVIDDSGKPPAVAQLKNQNPGAWVIGMGISVAHWHEWAREFGRDFCLFCRLSDLETTRMEMDSGLIWETLTAMTIRALQSPEVALWAPEQRTFRCHIIIEMFPHGILYLGPEGVLLRHRKSCQPEKSSPRHRGSVPCYDTLVTSMLAQDCIRNGRLMACQNYFSGFSEIVLNNWQFLYEHGYAFDGQLQLPKLDFSPTCGLDLGAMSGAGPADPFLIKLDATDPAFDQALEMVSRQNWTRAKKEAIRRFFPFQTSLPFAAGKKDGLPDNFLGIITEVLHYLKDEVSWQNGFENLRLFHVGNLRTTDPVEIDAVTTLQNVMDSYVSRDHSLRPLNIGVFGPPGSGKSFAVKEVARVIAHKFEASPFEFFEFNLTQFDGPDEINSAIEPVRASVAKGMVPIVFWDEFDCRYDGHEFGYLRYFLPSMQDGVTYVHGIPYNIGRAIFVFAGGVKHSWESMEQLLHREDNDLVRTLKIPDFLSRLRVVLDIDGINLPDQCLQSGASAEQLAELRRILLKRAFIIAHQMDTHWKKAARKTSGLLLRLLLANYKFGARSIEAVIESSGAADRLVYGLPELIAPSAARIHADWRIELERQVDQLRKDEGLRGIW